MKKKWIYLLGLFILFGACQNKKDNNFKIEEAPDTFNPPVSYEIAASKADSILQLMSVEEKIEIIGGHDIFFTKGYEKYGIPAIRFSDATQGISLIDYTDHLEKSVAFPAPIMLASTWNTDLSYKYAESIGEEARAGGISVLLGPGLNIYRISQNGRNFEYFGEDPFLVSRMVENYVIGLQNTGTVATLKHFVANNSDYRRRTSNSVVGERALREIYMPGFEAGINAGAMAVMTAYNQVNGKYAAQSEYVISDLLRKELGFKWLVMSDWLSIWNAEAALKSGLDLDMPGETEDGVYSPDDHEEYLRQEAGRLLEKGKIDESDIDPMVKNILTTIFAMEMQDPFVKELHYLDNFDQHVKVALETAREGVVLLKNEGILPFQLTGDEYIQMVGDYADSLAVGGGAAYVIGYDHKDLLTALREQFGDAVRYKENPSDQEIQNASLVLYTAATYDSEGSDVPFDLKSSDNDEILRLASLSDKVGVIMYTGGGKNMSKWNSEVDAILYGWYPGQIGNQAIAEIIAGITNPSGKLPITIEKEFKDSPGYPYLPEGEELYDDFEFDFDLDHPVHDIVYDEGVFVGYRWYEQKNIEPLYPFGHGLSYSTFEYSNLHTSAKSYKTGHDVFVKVDITNTSELGGKEIVQLYIRDIKSSVERPLKELKDFLKVDLEPGETKTAHFTLNERDFAFWDTTQSKWTVEPGDFEILVGSSSANIHLSALITMK
jgi:beta-glucosidase